MVAKQYRGKFCWSTDFSPKFLAALIKEGYLPMVRPCLLDKSQLSGVRYTQSAPLACNGALLPPPYHCSGVLVQWCVSAAIVQADLQ